ncbi:MAG: DUF4911 domain-containing protein [Thermincola sp.]|jgi:hypothetical protein|nr:DUF4911 domain-containing protein [Thermincola sp.]MDT3702576.1 DUF4911 domain-containing protein [Thermincola sp.]
MNNKCQIKVRMEPRQIVMLDNLIEGYDGLAIVSTGKGKTGEVTLHVTPDTYDDVMGILRAFPWPITFL